MIKGVKFVCIPTRDQDRAVEFFTSKLGFAIAADHPYDDKQRWVELRIPGHDTRVVPFLTEGAEAQIGTFMPVTFWTDDIDKTYNDFKSKGVSLKGPPEKAEWGSSLMFNDADGNQFLVSSK